MRIGIIALWQESNSFALHLTTQEMAQYGISRGEDIISRYENSLTELGGFIEILRASNVSIVPILTMHAAPAGPLTDPFLNNLLEEIEQGLSKNDLDGVLLCMHGSTVSESESDVCGLLASLVREKVGEKPVIATLDMHANPMPRLIASLDAVVCYKTNPHVDFKARGMQAAQMMIRCVLGKIEPTMAWSGIPMSTWGNTSLLQNLIDLGTAWESQADVLAVNACATHMPLNVFGRRILSSIVVTDGNREKATSLAQDLMKTAWERRESAGELDIQACLLPDAVQKALSMPQGSVALIDWSDSVTQGWPGDDPSLIRYVLENGILDPTCTILHDPNTVKEAIKAGVDTEQDFLLGGQWGGDLYSPLETTARVRGIFNGRIWPKASIWADYLGPMVTLQIENVIIVVTSVPVAAVDPNVFLSAGVDVCQFRLIQIKANALLSEDLVGSVVIGGPRNDIAAMPWTNVDPSQVYPFRQYSDEEMQEIIRKGD